MDRLLPDNVKFRLLEDKITTLLQRVEKLEVCLYNRDRRLPDGDERVVSSIPEPTLKEVESYFESCGYSKIDAQNFYSYYSSQDWVTSGYNGKSIKARWQNKVIQWMNNQKQHNIPKSTAKFTAAEEKYYDINKRKKNDLEFKNTFIKNEKKITEQGLYNPLEDPELQKLIKRKSIDTKTNQ